MKLRLFAPLVVIITFVAVPNVTSMDIPMDPHTSEVGEKVSEFVDFAPLRKAMINFCSAWWRVLRGDFAAPESAGEEGVQKFERLLAAMQPLVAAGKEEAFGRALVNYLSACEEMYASDLAVDDGTAEQENTTLRELKRAMEEAVGFSPEAADDFAISFADANEVARELVYGGAYALGADDPVFKAIVDFCAALREAKICETMRRVDDGIAEAAFSDLVRAIDPACNRKRVAVLKVFIPGYWINMRGSDPVTGELLSPLEFLRQRLLKDGDFHSKMVERMCRAVVSVSLSECSCR